LIVSVFVCSEHGEVELLDYDGQVANCSMCGKQMTKIAQYEQREDNKIRDMRDGRGRKLTKKVKVFECPDHQEIELTDFLPEKAFCPYCGREMKQRGEYME